MSGIENEQTDPEFETLLEHINRNHGFDFRGYKRSSLRRRIEKRMHDVGTADFSEYLAFLEAEPREYAQMLDTILVNVTSFFRDEQAWETLAALVLPQLTEKGAGESIRVWSAGCATGEEAYSIAILLVERLGTAEFQRRIKIYATDLDEAALASARNAVYPASAVKNVPEQFLDRYFEKTGGSFTFRRDLRKGVIFGRHNLLLDAPISRIDLLICRNLLIYLDVEAQSQVLPRLHYAMTDSGYLFLGKAETQIASSSLFTTVDMRSRIFRKREAQGARAYVEALAATPASGSAKQVHAARLMEALVNASPTALLLVNADGHLSFANSASRRLFGIAPSDIGLPFHDLHVSYRPVELRSRLEEAAMARRALRIDDVEFARPGAETVRLCIEIGPLYSHSGKHVASAISFFDVTRVSDLQRQVDTANQMLDMTVEELQSANEELETTNEELQSTNEELETTNEELQSANEELETINEELRSTNDELAATNEQLRTRSEQLDGNRSYMDAVLGSIGSGIIVVDSDLRVTSWNRRSENLWGLRREEAEGRRLLDLDIGLPVAEIEDRMNQSLNGTGGFSTQLDALDRRGRATTCRVIVTALKHDGIEPRGLVIVVDELATPSRPGANA